MKIHIKIRSDVWPLSPDISSTGKKSITVTRKISYTKTQWWNLLSDAILCQA